MNKKILYILLYLFMFSFTYVYSDEEIPKVNNTYACDFFSEDCVRFSEPFNTFEIEIDDSNSEFLEDIDYEIYNKYNQNNKVKAKIEKLRDDTYRVKNLNPFTESSVYVLDLTLNQKNKNVNPDNTQKFEFIFDNNKNIPSPIIHTNDFFIENKNFNVSNFNYNLFYSIPFKDRGVKNGISSDSIGFEKEFELDKIEDGVNVVNFYNGISGVYSTPIQRIVFLNYDEDLTSSGRDDITLRNLADSSLNYDTSPDGADSYTTKKKEFIIFGETKRNSIVYVNGIKTISDDSGKFASFVFLNEGLNEIDVVTNFSKKSINVTYLSSKNKILSLDYDKIIENDFLLNAKFLESSKYDIYVNGENVKSDFSDKIENFKLRNLQSGVNYLTIILENSQIFEDIFLVDNDKPKIEVFQEDTYVEGERFYFKLTDDISIDENNIIFKIGGRESNVENLFGDMYYVELENLNNGDHNYYIQTQDLVPGKFKTNDKTIKIDNDFLKIKEIKIDGGSGGVESNKNLILNRGSRTLDIIFSNDVLIDKIFIDNFHITDYEIKTKNQIKLEKDFQNENGVITFEYCKYDRNPCYSETYNYYIIDKPEVKLDYINKNFFLDEDSVKIYGEVESEFLDRDKLNGGLTLYSNIFEMIVYEDEYKEFRLCNILNKCTNTILNSQEKISSLNSQYDGLENYLNIREDTSKNFFFDSNYASQNFLTYGDNNILFSKKQENGFQINEINYFEGNRYFQNLLDISNIETFEMGINDDSNYEKNVYFKNLKENYYENEIEVVGNYIGDIQSIRVDSDECDKEDRYKTFKCTVFLDSGENIIEIEFDGNKKNRSVYNKYNSNAISIEDLTIKATDDNPMLLFDKEITILAQNFESGILSYMGQEKIITLDDSNQITIDLSDQILEDNLNFEVFIKEDRGSNIYTSNKLKYEYVGSNALSRIIIN